MKLELCLIPTTSFYDNLRVKLPPKRWMQLSNQIRHDHYYTCELCGYTGNPNQLHAHEQWEWDDEKLTQTLKKIVCVCDTCHSTQHWGLTHTKGYNMDVFCAHAAKVNGCTQKEFMEHVEESFKKWNERSTKRWTVQFGEFEHYLDGV